MAKPRHVDVNVELVTNTTKPGNVGFNPTSSVRVSNTSKGTHKFRFRNWWYPGFKIHFNIDDPHGLGWEFPATPAPDNPLDAMWVTTVQSEDDPCPTKPMHWPGFKAVRVEHHNGRPNSRLVVENPNNKEELFAFTLVLRNRSGKTVLYDPIGDDRNGPTRFTFFSLAVPVIGVAAIALVGYVAFRSLTGA